tara:strand:+ start:847 stop:1020 length:174 start_codon:yes stop_codon:yes gene_type:complete
MVGAVLLAGLAGFMMTEQSDSTTIELTNSGSYEIVVDVVNGDTSIEEISSGESSNGS